MGREYNGRPITKETVNFGVGGTFVRDDGFPELPPKARVHADVWFDFDHVKHKFLDHGEVEETLILTLEVASFKVLDVEEPPPEPEQISIDEGTDLTPVGAEA